MEVIFREGLLPGSSCLICEDKCELSQDPGGETSSVALKQLLQYLNVDVSKVVALGKSPTGRGTGGGGGLEVIASTICEECAFLANAFGPKYRIFKEALRFMSQVVSKLSKRLKSNLGGGDDGLTTEHKFNLKAEILRQCELKLKPTEEEQLPCVEEKQVVEADAPKKDGLFEDPVSVVVEDSTDVREMQSAGVREEQEDENSKLRQNIPNNPSGEELPTSADEHGGDTGDGDGGWTPLNLSTDDSRVPPSPPPPKASRHCVHCQKPLLGPKSIERRHLLCCHTFETLSGQRWLAGKSSSQLDKVIKDICQGELVLPSASSGKEEEDEAGNTSFQCSFCRESVKVEDKKFHLVSSHLAIVRSRLDGKSNSGAKKRAMEGATQQDGGWIERKPKLLKTTANIKVELRHQVEHQLHQRSEHFQQGHQDPPQQNSPTADAQSDDFEEDEMAELQQRLCDELDEESSSLLEGTCHTCGYCNEPLLGPPANMKRHMVCVHPAACFSAQLAGFTDQDVDRVILEMGKEGQVATNSKDQNTSFHCCPFCEKPVEGDDENKYHYLNDHLDLVVSRLKIASSARSEEPIIIKTPFQIKREAAAEQSSAIVPEVSHPDSSHPAPPPEVLELPTILTLEMRKRQNVKSDFLQNREHYKTSTAKPPFTYAFLIRHAIMESPLKELHFNDIISWIQHNFPFYQKGCGAKTRQYIGTILTSKSCFVRVDLGGGGRGDGGGVWRVKDREFYKASTVWSRKTCRPEKMNLTTSSSLSNPLNLKLEVDLGGDQVDQSGNILDATGSPSENSPTAAGGRRPSLTSTSEKCLYCDALISGPKMNIKRHMICLHTIQHLAGKLSPGVTQAEVNCVVRAICNESIKMSEEKVQTFHCALCGKWKTGDRKAHILQHHEATVLSRLESEGAGRQEAPPVPVPSVPISSIISLDEILESTDLRRLTGGGGGGGVVKVERKMDQDRESSVLAVSSRSPAATRLFNRTTRRQTPIKQSSQTFKNILF